MRKLTRFDLHDGGVKGREIQGQDITFINQMYWRGDTRPPEIIFPNGFRRRDDTAGSYFDGTASSPTDGTGYAHRLAKWKELNEAKQQHPGSFAGKAFGPETIKARTGDRDIMAPSLPHFRDREKDISPATAVCVASSFVAASLFPILSKNKPRHDSVWVYAVQIENGFNTFQMQVHLNDRRFNFAQEACCHDIPPMHVLGAIHVPRRWNSDNWEHGATGFIPRALVDRLFIVNEKSVGCVGRDTKLQNARNEIRQALGGNNRYDIRIP